MCRGKIRLYWTFTIGIFVILVAAYVWIFLYARKRQKKFDEQYNAAKERHEVFVLNKKVVKERPRQKWLKYAKFKTYQVVGRLSVSQSVRGVQMSKMHTMTFQTSKSEYEKIEPNHKYKMDLAGNYIGFVNAPVAGKTKSKKKDTTPAKGTKGAKAEKNTKKAKDK